MTQVRLVNKRFPLLPDKPKFHKKEDADSYNNYSLDYDYNIDNELGNNGEIFTNDEGQSIPNPEGYATTSEIT